jgi:hypothetical protein
MHEDGGRNQMRDICMWTRGQRAKRAVHTAAKAVSATQKAVAPYRGTVAAHADRSNAECGCLSTRPKFAINIHLAISLINHRASTAFAPGDCHCC